MISGLVPFSEIVSSVKDETGIENMRPLYEKLRRLIFRAEREIGYGGTIVLKKITYKNPNDYTGIYFPYPLDFIELEGIGQNGYRMCPTQYSRNPEGIRFKKTQTIDVVLLYWGIYCDGEGNPVTTRNHEEAVIAYIVWKLYAPKVFLGIGNFNAKVGYEEAFIIECGAARGDDAFPTLEEMTDIGRLSYADRRGLIMYPTASYNYCDDSIMEDCSETSSNAMPVHYWQLSNVVDRIEQVIPLLSEAYLATKPFKNYEQFEIGTQINYTLIGRVCFAIVGTEDIGYIILDILGNDISNLFDRYYDEDLKTLLYVSDEIRSYSTIGYTFKQQ